MKPLESRGIISRNEVGMLFGNVEELVNINSKVHPRAVAAVRL